MLRASKLDYPEELNTGSNENLHWVICGRFPGGETYQVDLVNPW